MNTTPLYIFDLDGTLADLMHRRHHVAKDKDAGGKLLRKPNWDAFHAACVDDTPIKPIIGITMALTNADAEIWVWSGRSDSVHNQTLAWLRAWCPWYDHLKMRKHGDHTPDDVLKESWLHAMNPEDRARLVMTFDDRDRVVAMWRRNGVVCAQVAPGDF
jgi:hypothetical protein